MGLPRKPEEMTLGGFGPHGDDMNKARFRFRNVVYYSYGYFAAMYRNIKGYAPVKPYRWDGVTLYYR